MVTKYLFVTLNSTDKILASTSLRKGQAFILSKIVERPKAVIFGAEYFYYPDAYRHQTLIFE